MPPLATAQFLNTTQGTLAVWRCRRRYGLRYVRIGRRILFKPSSISRFLDQREAGGDIHPKRGRKTRHFIEGGREAGHGILEVEYPMTVRQLFYRLVSIGTIQNDRASYQTVSR